jgi:Tol biopolymer transport system component
MEIYTTSLTARGNEVAITSDGGQNIHAAWSPDGQWLAFHSRQKGGIWIVPAGGGVARRVVDFGSVPVWTADGERIVFSSIAGGMAAQSLLWTVNRDGTHTAPLTSLGNPRGGHSQPSVSPDGRFVAFAVAHGLLRTEVRMMPISGGESTSLGEGTLYASPRFSPDSRSVYWAGRTPEGNDALMRIAIDDAGRRTGTPETVLPFIGNFVGGLSIARNGTAVMSLYRAVANLWSVSVAPTGAQQPAVQLTFDDVRNTAPRFSPDGHVAFHQQAVGQPNTTWVMDADGQNRQALTVGLAESVWGPQWAPDGRRLFVIVVAKGGATSFAWIDTVTRQMTPIPLPVDGALSPVLSPDGREIAFHVIDTAGVLNVWRQPLAGGPRTQVTFDSEAMSYPQWSWDGKWLAVEIKRGDQTYMGVVSREGGAVEEVVTEKGQTWPFSWPANDRIVFAGERDGVWNVYSVSRATKEVRRLTDFSSVRGYVRYPAASHDGSRIIFERGEQTGSLWTVQLP